MPRYCYFCPECGEKKTISAPFDHDPPTCKCDGDEYEMQRDYNAEGIGGIHFKGSGFHVNDYE